MVLDLEVLSGSEEPRDLTLRYFVAWAPDYDNLILSHTGRRVSSDEHRKKEFLFATRVRTTFSRELGSWAVRGRSRRRGAATLIIGPFEPLPKNTREALMDQGEQLVRFVGAGTALFEVWFAGELWGN